MSVRFPRTRIISNRDRHAPAPHLDLKLGRPPTLAGLTGVGSGAGVAIVAGRTLMGGHRFTKPSDEIACSHRASRVVASTVFWNTAARAGYAAVVRAQIPVRTCVGVVVRRNFYGHDTVDDVRLGSGEVLRMRGLGHEIHEVGAPVEVSVKGNTLSSGAGKTKKLAEQEAAKEAYKKLLNTDGIEDQH